jgi:hypothetical protein
MRFAGLAHAAAAAGSNPAAAAFALDGRCMKPFPLVAGAAALLAAFGALAASPLHFRAFGFDLYSPPMAALATFERDYQACYPVRSIYHERPGDRGAITASLSVNPGMIYNDIGAPDVCSYSPAGDGITDSVEAKFVHPDVDPAQPMYALAVQRLYPDVAYGRPGRLRNTFAALRMQLFRMYGRPVDQRREKIVSSAADLAASLGIGDDIKRQDYLVRYLWTAKGKLLDQEEEESTCRCDAPYVKAVIEISRSPATIPKNTYYVLSMKISVEDPVLRARQDKWNAQWLSSTASPGK